jgi:hypothetical protein
MNLSSVSKSVGAAFMLGLSSVAGAASIVDVAPESTVLVIHVEDASRSWDRFQNSPLWRLWMSPEMREQRDKVMESFGQGLDDMAEELEIDRESIKPPTGPVGGVLCTALDDESGFAIPAIVILADYGEHADGMNEVITALVEKGDDEGVFEYEIEEIAGRDVWAVTKLDDEMDGDGGMNQMGRGGGPDFEQIVQDAMKTMYLVRDENTFIIASHRPHLAYALDVIDDRAELNALRDRDDYQGMTSGLEGYDMTAVLMFRDMGPLVSAADPMGMTMMIAPMLQQFIGDVKGFSMGFRFADDDEVLAESRLLAYMPNGRVGLTALLDTETDREDLPNFVGLNASTFSRVNVEFQGLPPIVRQAMMMFPMAAPQNGPQPHEIVEQFTAAMGQQMYMLEVIERPLKPGSVGNLIIVECPEMQKMETALASIGMLEPRDFAGGRIFDIDMSGMMMGGPGMGGGMDMEPQGLGLAGGYMFSGPMAAVEQALRSLAEDEHTTLASDPMFERAVQFLPADAVVAWGYQDVVASAEAQAMLAQHQYEQMVEMFAEEDPEWAEEMEALREDDPMAMLAEFDWGMLRDYIGPQVWDLRATEKGFEMRSWMLKAAEAEAE